MPKHFYWSIMRQLLQILVISELQVEIQVCPLVTIVVWLGVSAVMLIPWGVPGTPQPAICIPEITGWFATKDLLLTRWLAAPSPSVSCMIFTEACQIGILDSSSNFRRQVLLCLVQKLSLNVHINIPCEVSQSLPGSSCCRAGQIIHRQNIYREPIENWSLSCNKWSHRTVFCT